MGAWPMRSAGLRIATAILLVLAVCGGGSSPASAQLDLKDLGPPWPQPNPGKPFIELDAAIGKENWKTFFSELAQSVAPEGFAAYPYARDPYIEHAVGMIFWRDDLFVNLYNRHITAPDVFTIGLFYTNLEGDTAAAVAQFLANLRKTVSRIPGASLGDNYAKLAEAEKPAPRPPLRTAEIAVPAQHANDVMEKLARFAGRRGFNHSPIPAWASDAAQVDLWRTEMKIVIRPDARNSTFAVTVVSYLPLPEPLTPTLDELAGLYLETLGEIIGQIPGGGVTLKR
jgi:hypothetical protein